MEGVFFYLPYGVIGGSVIHYLVAKIAGPSVSSKIGLRWPEAAMDKM
jgi:hypothetical protein